MTDASIESSLFDRLKAAGCELDHWGSDLYALATPDAREIIRGYEDEGGTSNKSSFRDEKGRLWLQLGHHYVPYWNASDEPGESAARPGP